MNLHEGVGQLGGPVSVIHSPFIISIWAPSKKNGEMRLQMSHSPQILILRRRDVSGDLLTFQNALSNQLHWKIFIWM